MLGLGFSEILFIAILALVVIGPKQLPEVARTLGRFINELRRTTGAFSDELKSQVRIDPLDLGLRPKAKAPGVPETKAQFPMTPKKTEPHQPELPIQAEFPLAPHDDEQKSNS